MKRQLLLAIATFTFSWATLAQNVGIGTNVPDEKLHIEGNLRVDGDTIKGDMDKPATQFNIVSNGGVRINLDFNNDGGEVFGIKNSGGTIVFEVDEDGNINTDGDLFLEGGGGNLIDMQGTSPVFQARENFKLTGRSSISMIIDSDNSGTGSSFNIQNDAGNNLFSVTESSQVTVYSDGTNAGAIKFRETSANGTNFMGIRAPSTISSNFWLTFPTTDGGAGDFLKTDGSGNLTWDTPTGQVASVNQGAATTVTGTSTDPIVNVSVDNVSIEIDGTFDVLKIKDGYLNAQLDNDYIQNQDAATQTGAKFKIAGDGTLSDLFVTGNDITSTGGMDLHSNGLFEAYTTTDARILLDTDGNGSESFQIQKDGSTSAADRVFEVTEGGNMTLTGDAEIGGLAGTGVRNVVVAADGTLQEGASDVGDITEVIAGSGLTGGGANGSVTLNTGAGDGITVNADDVAVDASAIAGTGLGVSSNNLDVNYGTTAGTAVQGNQTATVAAGSGLTGGVTTDALGDGFTATLNIGDGDGLTVSADDIDVNVDNTTIEINGSDQLAIKNIPANDADYIWNQAVNNNFGSGQSADFDITGNAEIGGTLEVSGNVGIGNTSPDYALDVSGDIGVDKYIYHNGDDNTGIWFTSDRVQMRAGTAEGSPMLDIQGASSEVAINENGLQWDFRVEGGNDANLLFTDGSADFVGIGTSGPIQKLDVNGRMHINNGVIQRGGAAITNTSDLGLYSRVAGNWMRFVTNNAPIRFYSDDAAGTTSNITIEADGDLAMENGNSIKMPNNIAWNEDRGTRTQNNDDNWKWASNWSGWMAVESGNIIKVEVNTNLRLTGGSGNDDWYVKVRVDGTGGCADFDTEVMGWVRPDEGGSDHDNFKSVSYLDVFNVTCNGSMRYAVQIQNTGDDGWESRETIVVATKY